MYRECWNFAVYVSPQSHRYDPRHEPSGPSIWGLTAITVCEFVAQAWRRCANDGLAKSERGERLSAASHTAQIAALRPPGLDSLHTAVSGPCENSQMRRPTLPHGARGIEADNLALQFGADKVVFVPRSAENGEHYTLQAGSVSGVLDLHETQMLSGRSERHRTLFAMRRDDVAAALGAMTPLLSELLGLLRPLRLGWLNHRNIGIARGVDLISDEDIAAATRKRRGRLTIDVRLYERNIFVPEFLEDVYDFPNGNFALFCRGRKIGIGFKTTVANGDVRLSWIKLSDLMRLGNRWQAKMLNALESFAISPERYAEFPHLQR